MKKLLISSLFVVMGFIGWACNSLPVTAPLGIAAPTPTPTSAATPLLVTATPTANLTPVCYSGAGLVPVTLPPGANLGLFNQTNPAAPAPFTIIRSQSDWNSLYGTSPPTAPVNFNTDMLVIVSNAACCPSEITGILEVCESPSGVNLTVSEVAPWYQCYTVCPGSILSAVAVPNSNLPVTWTVTTNPFI